MDWIGITVLDILDGALATVIIKFIDISHLNMDIEFKDLDV